MCALISYQLLIAAPTKLLPNFKLGDSTFLNFGIISSYPFDRFDSSIFVLYYPSFSFFYQFQIAPFMKKLFCDADLSNVLLQTPKLYATNWARQNYYNSLYKFNFIVLVFIFKDL